MVSTVTSISGAIFMDNVYKQRWDVIPTANPEHLAILERGVEARNAWNQEHPNVRADLYEADLSKTNDERVSGKGERYGNQCGKPKFQAWPALRDAF